MRLRPIFLFALLAVGLHAQNTPQRPKLPNRTPPPETAQNGAVKGAAKPVTVPVGSSQQLGPNTGWASTGRALIWTKDNGQHWVDITPPNPHYHRLDGNSALTDVFFLDEQAGWVLFSYLPSPQTGAWAFDISETQDGGQTWVTNPVVAPDLDTDRLGGTGYISFSDPLHGWANLSIQSGSAFNIGALLETYDGGKTWSFLAGDPGLAGPVRRLENGNGWLVHDGDSDLEATLDQGKSFHQVQMPIPADLSFQEEPQYTVYGLPSFTDNRNGFEPVVFTNSDGSKSELVLFHTGDGGVTWAPDRRLRGLGLASLTTIATASLADASWVIPVALDSNQPTLTVIPAGGVSRYPSQLVNQVRASSFIDSGHGWISLKAGLFATDDGGRTWYKISPTFTIGKGLGSSYTGMPQTDFGPTSSLTAGKAAVPRVSLSASDNPAAITSGIAQNPL